MDEVLKAGHWVESARGTQVPDMMPGMWTGSAFQVEVSNVESQENEAIRQSRTSTNWDERMAWCAEMVD